MGVPGSHEFLASLTAAEDSQRQRTAGTLAGLIRDFEGTKQWRRLAESTKKEYRRVFAFWDAEYGTCPYRALEDKKFRAEIIRWHDNFSKAKPREADNRVAILARLLSWAAKDGPLRVNVLDGFERATQATVPRSFGCPNISKRLCGLHHWKCNSRWCSLFTPDNDRRTFFAWHGVSMTARRSPFDSVRPGGLAGWRRSFVFPALEP